MFITIPYTVLVLVEVILHLATEVPIGGWQWSPVTRNFFLKSPREFLFLFSWFIFVCNKNKDPGRRVYDTKSTGVQLGQSSTDLCANFFVPRFVQLHNRALKIPAFVDGMTVVTKVG
jgi:hypothetical protein